MKTSEQAVQSPVRLSRLILDNCEELVAVLLLSIIGVVMAGQVAFRTVFNAPLSWPEELSQFLFVWASLLGAVGATKRAQLVRFESVLNWLPSWLRTVFEYVSFAAITVFLLVLGWKAVQLGTRTSFAATTLPITWAWAYAGVPVFSIASVTRLVQARIFGYRFTFVECAVRSGAKVPVEEYAL
jgi:TRAP-type transport system small permease protein